MARRLNSLMIVILRGYDYQLKESEEFVVAFSGVSDFLLKGYCFDQPLTIYVYIYVVLVKRMLRNVGWLQFHMVKFLKRGKRLEEISAK